MAEQAPRGFRIVVGVDFTTEGDHALDEALRYVHQLENDELHAVHVVPDHRRVERLSDALVSGERRLRAHVLTRARALGESWEQAVSFHVRVGDVADAIHQVAVDVEADLIIVGTHARRGLEKVLLGSVAERLVREAHLPVMVARPNTTSQMRKSDRPEPPSGDGVSDETARWSREHVRFGRRDSHISGLV